ncbi:MAG: hypothetical protein QXJ28_00470 [Candidatus Pacearchaeota archaeon]
MKILEAIIAVILVASLLLFLISNKTPKEDSQEYIETLSKLLLEKLSHDEHLRELVVSDNNGNNIETIKSSLSIYIPDHIGFELNICPIEEICGLKMPAYYYTKNSIYSNEISISSTFQTYNPKKVRIFLWKK